MKVTKALRKTGLAASKAEARRLIRGGGVFMNGASVCHEEATVPDGKTLLEAGNRRFAVLDVDDAHYTVLVPGGIGQVIRAMV